MTKNELRLLEAALDRKLRPIHSLLQKHEQSLYGETGENGLKGDIKQARREIKLLQRLSWMVSGGLVVIGSAVFWKLIINN
ncbi:MAG: hypothetical protein L0Y80_01000 [Ignavibacteriae bacterium]|nr:hypothetical protein [Ignavibacteriota bacterium]